MRFKPRKPKDIRLNIAIVLGMMPALAIFAGGIILINWGLRQVDLPWYVELPASFVLAWYFAHIVFHFGKKLSYVERMFKFTCWAQGWRCDGCKKVIEYDPKEQRAATDEPALCGSCFFKSNTDVKFRDKVRANVSL